MLYSLIKIRHQRKGFLGEKSKWGLQQSDGSQKTACRNCLIIYFYHISGEKNFNLKEIIFLKQLGGNTQPTQKSEQDQLWIGVEIGIFQKHPDLTRKLTKHEGNVQLLVYHTKKDQDCLCYDQFLLQFRKINIM